MSLEVISNVAYNLNIYHGKTKNYADLNCSVHMQLIHCMLFLFKRIYYVSFET